MARRTAVLTALVAEVLTDGRPGAVGPLAEQCLGALHGAAVDGEGRVIEAAAPEFLAIFATARAGLAAAVAMQRAALGLARVARERGGVELVALRIGVHHGAVVVEEGTVFGDAVNEAALLAQYSTGGHIVVSGQVVQLLPSETRDRFIAGEVGSHAGERARVGFEIDWHVRPATAAGRDFASEIGSFVVKHRGIELAVGPSRSTLVVGRGARADLQIADAMVSREHLHIDWRRGEVYLTDQSTNGTYIETSGSTVYLLREEMKVTHAGWLSLGRSFGEVTEPVQFYFVGQSS